MKKQVESAVAVNSVEKHIIDVILDVISDIDVDAIKQASASDDTEIRRSSVASLIIESAHRLNELQSVKSVSTMRELLYSLIAVDTLKSKAFHAKHDAHSSKTLEDIEASDNALLVFSTMYKREFDKHISK
jgi:hypothetical protein